MKYTTSGRGGTGRRASFRGWRAQARAGSSPAAPTIVDLSHPHGWFFHAGRAPHGAKRSAARREKENGDLKAASARAALVDSVAKATEWRLSAYGYMKFP